MESLQQAVAVTPAPTWSCGWSWSLTPHPPLLALHTLHSSPTAPSIPLTLCCTPPYLCFMLVDSVPAAALQPGAWSMASAQSCSSSSMEPAPLLQGWPRTACWLHAAVMGSGWRHAPCLRLQQGWSLPAKSKGKLVGGGEEGGQVTEAV